ncbi:MAG: InlB B-repeat-containing protein, partial [Clostridiales bacterium]|nr:InlB B-repeat-containing protein [Clostridiales bacterium]
IGGKTYTGGAGAEKYTLKVKYEMEISKVFPVQGVPELFQFSKGFSSWQPPNSMVTGAGIASIRKIVDSSLLSSKGQTLHYTLTASWGTDKNEYAYRYFVEVLPGETPPTNQRITIGETTYRLMEEYNQKYSGNLTQKEINGLKRAYSSWIGYDYDLKKGVFTPAKKNPDFRCFFYTRTTHKLQFNLMAKPGEVSNASVFKDEIVAYDEPLAKYEPTQMPNRPGFIFKGWYKDNNYNEEFDFNGYMPIGGLIAYASWESKENIITFLDGKNGKELPHYSQGVANGAYAINREDYWQEGEFVKGKGNFNGWYHDTKGIPSKWSWDRIIYRNYTLYAQWITDGFTITYDLAGGEGTLPVDSNTYDMYTTARVKNTDASMEDGRIFYAWKDQLGNIYSPGDFINISNTGSVLLTAQYANHNDLWTVTYHHNHGVDTKEIVKVKKDNNGITLAGEIFTSKDRSKLIGWSTAPNAQPGGSNVYTLGAENVPIKEDTHFYGVWSKVVHSVSFLPGNHGSLEGKTTFTEIEDGKPWGEVFDGVAGKIPTVKANEGYYFVGWNPPLLENTATINDNMKFVATYQQVQPLTLTAKSESRTYSGENQSLSGFTSSVEGLTFKTATGVALVAQGNGKDAGEYDVAFNEDAGKIKVYREGEEVTKQYQITLDVGTFTITPATLTVTAENQQIAFGASPLPYGYTIEGFKRGDTEAVVAGAPILSSKYTAGDSAGEYD